MIPREGLLGNENLVEIPPKSTEGYNEGPLHLSRICNAQELSDSIHG